MWKSSTPIQVRLSKVFKVSGVVVEQKTGSTNSLAFHSRWSRKGKMFKGYKNKKIKWYGNSEKEKKESWKTSPNHQKEIRAAVRFSKLEYFAIRQKASKAGIKASAYIREAAINGQVTERLSDEERQIFRQIIGMAGNLNQLVKNNYKEGMLKTMLYFEAYRNQFDTLLKKFNHA